MYTPEEMEAKIDEYMTNCDESKKPRTVAGLCVHLGMIKQSLSAYENGERGEEYIDIVKFGKLRIEADKNEKMLIGDYVAAPAIFDLKHNHGWTDQHQVETTHKGDHENPIQIQHTMRPQMTREEWIKTYVDAPAGTITSD